MRNKKAKQIRKRVYGDRAVAEKYEWDGGTRKCAGLRNAYQQMKKLHGNGKRVL